MNFYNFRKTRVLRLQNHCDFKNKVPSSNIIRHLTLDNFFSQNETRMLPRELGGLCFSLNQH